MSNAHLITGATGFVGGAIALELLATTSSPLVCVVRARGERSPQDRLQQSLTEAAHAYGLGELIPDVLTRTRAVTGDIAGAMPSLAEIGRVDVVWHCAASLRFEDRYADSIERHNVHGTRAVLDLANEIGAAEFNHVSTAYVAGLSEGVITEAPSDDVAPVHNHYERTKRHAEGLVLAAPGLHARVMRPSVVIGHSDTHAVTSFSGMYGFLRELLAFRTHIRQRLGDLLELRPLRVLADPDVSINLIPVNDVARQAVAVSRSDSTASHFHLTNPSPPRLGDAVRLAFDLLNLRNPRFAASPRELNAIDKMLSDRIPFYGSYMTGQKAFDRTNTDAALGGEWAGRILGEDVLMPYLQWWHQQAGPIEEQRVWTSASA